MQKHEVLGLGPQSQLSTHTVLLSLREAVLLSTLPRQRSWRGCAQCACLRWVSRSRTSGSLPAQPRTQQGRQRHLLPTPGQEQREASILLLGAAARA